MNTLTWTKQVKILFYLTNEMPPALKFATSSSVLVKQSLNLSPPSTKEKTSN